jgi:hypothetical protein
MRTLLQNRANCVVALDDGVPTNPCIDFGRNGQAGAPQ